MADETSTKKPKRRTCAQTKKKIQRKNWYYRNGEYFINQAAFNAWNKKKIEEKAEAEAKIAAEEKAAAEKSDAKKEENK